MLIFMIIILEGETSAEKPTAARARVLLRRRAARRRGPRRVPLLEDQGAHLRRARFA